MRTRVPQCPRLGSDHQRNEVYTALHVPVHVCTALHVPVHVCIALHVPVDVCIVLRVPVRVCIALRVPVCVCAMLHVLAHVCTPLLVPVCGLSCAARLCHAACPDIRLHHGACPDVRLHCAARLGLHACCIPLHECCVSCHMLSVLFTTCLTRTLGLVTKTNALETHRCASRTAFSPSKPEVGPMLAGDTGFSSFGAPGDPTAHSVLSFFKYAQGWAYACQAMGSSSFGDLLAAASMMYGCPIAKPPCLWWACGAVGGVCFALLQPLDGYATPAMYPPAVYLGAATQQGSQPLPPAIYTYNNCM